MLKMPLEKIYFKAGGNNDYDDDYDDVFPGDIIEQITSSLTGLVSNPGGNGRDEGRVDSTGAIF
jgi:hypothetical protein